ncbi:MAG: hypothetical protein K2X32_02715 [Phycisphaerales bacterium]|nr:hypothetical protein [Phycisphaerales bacterium]
MKLYLDDVLLICPTDTLESALDVARNAAQSTGRVIIEAEWDGVPIPDNVLEAADASPVSQSEVRFRSTDPRALVATTMHEMADVLQRGLEVQLETADALQSGQMEVAFSNLTEVLEMWQGVRRSVEDGAALMGARVDTLITTTPEGTSEMVMAHVGRLNDLLTDVRTAVASEDWATLADLLSAQSEMDVQARRWIGILRQLGQQFAPPTPPPAP